MDDIRPPQPESEVLPPRPVSLEELYVSSPHPAEDSWAGAFSTVGVSLAVAVTMLLLWGHRIW